MTPRPTSGPAEAVPRFAVLATVGLLLAVAGAYAAAPEAPFFWDDQVLILDNPVIQEGRLGEALFGNLWGGMHPSPYHRPLVVLTFCLDQILWGSVSAGPWHLHSLAWHLLATGAVVWLAAPRMGSPRALVAASIFALHPIQSEAVMWVSARNDLMCMAFIAAALRLLDRDADTPTGGAAVAAALVTLAACLSKELGYALPLLWFAWRRAFGLSTPRRPFLVALLGAGVALVLRSHAELQVTPWLASDSGLPVPLWRPVVSALGWLVWPWPLTSATAALTALTAVEVAAASVALVGFSLLVLWRRPLGWLVAVAALLWSPTLPVYHHTGLVGERYLYVPLAFVAVAVAAAWPARHAERGFVVAGVAGLMALGALGVRLADWRSQLALVESAALRVPNSYTLSWYSDELARAGKVRAAVEALERAVRFRPLRPAACTQVPEAFLRAGEPRAALAVLERLDGTACATMPRVRVARVLALWGVGKIGEAWDRVLRWEGPTPPTLGPVFMALCTAQRDFTCAGSLLVQWEDGVADLLSAVEDVRAMAEPVPSPVPP